MPEHEKEDDLLTEARQLPAPHSSDSGILHPLGPQMNSGTLPGECLPHSASDGDRDKQTFESSGLDARAANCGDTARRQ
jgi:hypothetical protein